MALLFGFTLIYGLTTLSRLKHIQHYSNKVVIPEFSIKSSYMQVLCRQEEYKKIPSIWKLIVPSRFYASDIVGQDFDNKSSMK